MKTESISRESVKEIKNEISPLMDNGLEKVVQFSYELSKRLAREYKGPMLKKVPSEIQLSEEDIKRICLDFYRKFDDDAYRHVESILNGTNTEFQLVFYDPATKPDYPDGPCVTENDGTFAEAGDIQNIVCMPLKGYGTKEARIGIENLFQLAHELSHTWAISNICSKDENGQYNLETMEAPQSFLFQETESKMIEHLLAGYLIAGYPDYREVATDYARGKLIDAIHRDALDSYIKIGVSKFEGLKCSTDEYLEPDELDELALSLGFSKTENMMAKMGSYTDEDGKFYQDDIKFRYLFGSIASMYVISQSVEDKETIAAKMKKFFDMEKTLDMKGALRELGLGNVKIDDLVSMYSQVVESDREFYEQLGKMYLIPEHKNETHITPDEIEAVTKGVRLSEVIHTTNGIKEAAQEGKKEIDGKALDD